MRRTTSEKSVLAEAEEEVNGVDENIPNLDFLGTRRFFPFVSTVFSCVLITLGASAREEFGPFAAAAASHESSKARAKEAELLVELPPSEEEMTVEEGVAEINRIEGIGLGTGGALACIALGRDEWSSCVEGRWFVDEETNGMIIVVVVKKSCCWR